MLHVKNKINGPVLPALFAAPLKVIPDFVHNNLMCSVLNKLFATQIKEGELDFLNQRSIAIVIYDTGVSFKISFTGEKFIFSNPAVSDLTISASLYDYIILVSRTQDPDSLVFQRRLVMEGDTELGLGLKNFLDALDIESSRLLKITQTLSGKTLPLYQRLFG